MNKVNLNIWGRTFDLDVEYDCYSNEAILPVQKEALKLFVNSSAVNTSKNDVEDYCLKKNPDEIGANHIDNIFKYVIPKYIYVKRNEEKRIVALMCNYKFEMEQGIAIVFENEKLVKIGNQNIIL